MGVCVAVTAQPLQCHVFYSNNGLVHYEQDVDLVFCHTMCDVCCISVHSTSPLDVLSALHGIVSFFLPR